MVGVCFLPNVKPSSRGFAWPADCSARQPTPAVYARTAYTLFIITEGDIMARSVPDDITHKRIAMQDYANHLIDALLAGREQDAQFCADYLKHAQQSLKEQGFAARISVEGDLIVETVKQNRKHLRREEGCIARAKQDARAS
jgi:hypothetical protein